MIKMMMAVVILACIAPFFIQGPDGKPLMTLDKLMSSRSESAQSVTGANPDQQRKGQPSTVYKWQDAEGVWHFSDREEDAGIAGAEKVVLNGAINVMPAFKAPPAGTTPQTTRVPTTPAFVPSIGAGLDTLNQAKELQSSIDSRKADIDKALRDAGGR